MVLLPRANGLGVQFKESDRIPDFVCLLPRLYPYGSQVAAPDRYCQEIAKREFGESFLQA